MSKIPKIDDDNVTYITLEDAIELRCSNPACISQCASNKGKLLGKTDFDVIEIKCPVCKTVCRFQRIGPSIDSIT